MRNFVTKEGDDRTDERLMNYNGKYERERKMPRSYSSLFSQTTDDNEKMYTYIS